MSTKVGYSYDKVGRVTGFSLDDLQTRARRTSFLLGSLLLPLLQIEEDHPGTYAEVLSETGAFLRHVYSYRWKHRHQWG